jgi:tagatose-1,6-bisphosphate aldolase
MISNLSIGKLRGLQQCATARGAFSVFALDHRNNLRRALHPEAPDSTTTEEMSAFKQQVIANLAPAASAVLLDPQVGAAQCIAAGGLPGQVGLAVALEATGYTGDPAARQSKILPGWSVAKAKRMGANAIKLLVYYHPDSPTAPEIETLVQQVVDDCTAHDIALFLEPLSYSLDPNQKKVIGAERRRVVVETAQRLVIPGVDVLKAEFPLDIIAEPDEREWSSACAELSAASACPWVLLSASVDHETYLRQVVIACQAGASGVAVGRAVWKEAVSSTGQDRIDFLQGPAYDRMVRITQVCNSLARPWTQFYPAPTVDADWYEQYEEKQ